MTDNAAFWAKLHGKDASLAAYFRERGYDLSCPVPDDVYMRLYQEWEAQFLAEIGTVYNEEDDTVGFITKQ